MTAVLLVSGYFIALSAFLGLDIISKVPATLYPLVLAALGTVGAVVVVGAVLVTTRAVLPASAGLAAVGAGFAAAAGGAGLGAVVRWSRALDRRPRRS